MTIIMETLPDRTATSTERSNNYIYFFLLLVNDRANSSH